MQKSEHFFRHSATLDGLENRSSIQKPANSTKFGGWQRARAMDSSEIIFPALLVSNEGQTLVSSSMEVIFDSSSLSQSVIYPNSSKRRPVRNLSKTYFSSSQPQPQLHPNSQINGRNGLVASEIREANAQSPMRKSSQLKRSTSSKLSKLPGFSDGIRNDVSRERPKTASSAHLALSPKRIALQSPLDKYKQWENNLANSSLTADKLQRSGDSKEVWMDVKVHDSAGIAGQVYIHPNHTLKDARAIIIKQLSKLIKFKFYFLYSDGIKINFQQERKLRAVVFWPCLFLRLIQDEPIIEQQPSQPLINPFSASIQRGKGNNYQDWVDSLMEQDLTETQKILQNTKVSLQEYADRAAIIIQSFVRKKNAIQAYERKKLEHHSAREIQKIIRGHQAKQVYFKKVEQFEKEQAGAVAIQSCFRRMKAKCQLKTMQFQKRAPIIIQSWWRRILAKHMFLKKKEEVTNVTLIQAEFRRWIAMKSAAVIREKQSIAATCVQSHVRRWQKQKDFSTKRECAVKIQTKTRQWKAKKDVAYRKLLRKVALKCVHQCIDDNLWFIAGRILATDLFEVHSAKTIQAFFCELSAKAKQRAAATTIEKQIRKFLAQSLTKKMRKTLHQKEDAALKIQCLTRKKQAVAKASNQKAFLEQEVFFSIHCDVKTSDGLLFVHLRGDKQRIRCEYSAAGPEAAAQISIDLSEILRHHPTESTHTPLAFKIAYCLEKCRALRELEIQQFKEHVATTKIQSLARRKAAQKVMEQKKQEQYACIVIQTSIRRRLAQKHFREQQLAAKKIQSRIRTMQAKSKVQQLKELKRASNEKQKHLAATRIQSQIRRKHAQSQVDSLKTLQREERVKKVNSAAVQIQSHARRRQAQLYADSLRAKKTAKEAQRVNAAAVRIQAEARRMAAKAQVKVLRELKRNEAALKIQCFIRQLIAQNEYKKRIQKRNETAVVLIQSKIRSYLATKKVNELRAQKRNKAAISIQSIVRRRQAQKHTNVTRLEKHLADIEKKKQQLQAQGRHKIMENSAKQIQKTFAQFSDRKRLEEQQHKENFAATQIQSIVRSRHARAKAKQLQQLAEEQKVLQHECAVLIQAQARRRLAARILQDKKNKNQAATRIQRMVRRKQEEKRQKEKNKKKPQRPVKMFKLLGKRFIGHYWETSDTVTFTFIEPLYLSGHGKVCLTLEDFGEMGFFGSNLNDLDEESKQKLCFIRLTKWRMDQILLQRAKNTEEYSDDDSHSSSESN